MKSMTGFGSSSAQSEVAEIEVSIKAVNGRFLELRFHMPREYHSLESQLKKILNARLQRGTVDISIYRRPGAKASQGEVLMQLDLARKWVRSYQELGRSLGLPADLNLRQIAEHPEILKIEERTRITPQESGQLLKIMTQAVKACDEEREREGASVQTDLLQYLEQLADVRHAMGQLRTEMNREVAQRMKGRIGKLDVEVDAQRLAQEVAIYLDRADVAEELARLGEHLSVFKKLLKSRAVVGKKLDFYTQELLREVNTIGSKAQLAPLTELVVEAKTVIERIREQVQNIE